MSLKRSKELTCQYLSFLSLWHIMGTIDQVLFLQFGFWGTYISVLQRINMLPTTYLHVECYRRLFLIFLPSTSVHEMSFFYSPTPRVPLSVASLGDFALAFSSAKRSPRHMDAFLRYTHMLSLTYLHAEWIPPVFPIFLTTTLFYDFPCFSLRLLFKTSKPTSCLPTTFNHPLEGGLVFDKGLLCLV